ncbi:MAG: SusC/RagA family TonB-linked outer membrane protein, partial [Flavobacterium sp.]
LSKVLVQVFENQDFTYSLGNKIIVVSEREVKRSAIDIRGKITGEKGEPLPGASIQVKDQKISTVTNANGEFSLQNVPENATLQISYIGYITKEIIVGNRNQDLGAITLAMSVNTLNTVELVINTGYQKLSRERATGSFAVATTETIESRLNTDLRSALEGQLTGVVLDKSGNIEVRGVSTFTNGIVTPLVVVDGYPVEGGLDNINPLNISSVTVLKDGVAASIYGSRAANGVIVVTTKAGKLGTPKITYNGLLNFVSTPDLSNLNRSSTSDYIDAEIDLFNQNPNGASTISPTNMSRVRYLLMQVRDNRITQSAATEEINRLRSVNGLQQFQDAFFRQEMSTQHNFAISGASDKNNYNVALNLLDTRESYINSDYNRFILDIKDEWKPFKFLTAGITLNTLYSNRKAPMSDYLSLTTYHRTSILQPYSAIVDAEGNPAAVWGLSQFKVDTYRNTPGMKDWTNIPLEDVYKETRTTVDFQTRIGGFIRADIFKGLSAEFGGNWQRGFTQIRELHDADAFAVRIAYNDATSRANNANHYLPDGSVIDERRNITQNWTMRSQLNYNRDFDNTKHRISAIVGHEIRKLTFDNNQNETRVGYNEIAGSFIPMNARDYNAGIYNSDMLLGRNITLNPGSYQYMDNRFVSYYGNTSYEYDNRFILSGSIRLDLTNFFGTDPDYRYKPMWSVGGTYKLGYEPWFKNNFMSRLNLRGSYGINGNISLNQGPFLILSAGSFNATTGGVSYSVASPPNDQLRWERTSTANFGVDMTFWDNRVNASVDYYRKNSTDLLASESADPISGYTTVTKNAGAMTNNGIEISLNVDVFKNANFRWNVAPNFSYNFNKVTSYNVTRTRASNYAGARVVLAEGYSADGIWGYRSAGLNNLGEMMIYNVAGERISPDNATLSDVYYQGTIRPKYDLSLNNTFEYKNWRLSTLFIAKLGHKYRKDAFTGSNYLNRHTVERWKQPGDELNTIYPVLRASNSDQFDFPYTDVLVGDASYAKLRDVTLSYNLTKMAARLKMTNARVFVQGRNLFRITAKGTDIDPETAEVNNTGVTFVYSEQGYTSLPLPAELFFGITFSF